MLILDLHLFLDDKTNLGKPKFTKFHEMQLQSNTYISSGNHIRLSCHARGEKPMKYKWYKNTQELFTRREDSSLVTDQPELKLDELVLTDSANYTCLVENKHGRIKFTFVLRVQGVLFMFI